MEHGISQFEMMPGLNDQPAFIRTLSSLVLSAVQEESAAVAQAAAGGRLV
jgi:hypothetical protein